MGMDMSGASFISDVITDITRYVAGSAATTGQAQALKANSASTSNSTTIFVGNAQ